MVCRQDVLKFLLRPRLELERELHRIQILFLELAYFAAFLEVPVLRREVALYLNLDAAVKSILG